MDELLNLSELQLRHLCKGCFFGPLCLLPASNALIVCTLRDLGPPDPLTLPAALRYPPALLSLARRGTLLLKSKRACGALAALSICQNSLVSTELGGIEDTEALAGDTIPPSGKAGLPSPYSNNCFFSAFLCVHQLQMNSLHLCTYVWREGAFLKDQGRMVLAPGKGTVNSQASWAKGHPDGGGVGEGRDTCSVPGARNGNTELEKDKVPAREMDA